MLIDLVIAFAAVVVIALVVALRALNRLVAVLEKQAENGGSE